MSKLEQISKCLENKVANGEMTQEQADSLMESAKVKYAEEAVTEPTKEEAETSLEEGAEEKGVTLDEVMTTIRSYLADAKEKSKALEELEDEIDDVEDEIEDGEKKDKKEDKKDDDKEAKADEPAADEAPVEDAEGGEAATESTIDEAVVEEVNSLRLAVFEAAMAGEISADDKACFLEMLTLENYIVAE